MQHFNDDAHKEKQVLDIVHFAIQH